MVFTYGMTNQLLEWFVENHHRDEWRCLFSDGEDLDYFLDRDYPEIVDEFESWLVGKEAADLIEGFRKSGASMAPPEKSPNRRA